MAGTLHFKSRSAYQRYLAYGHIHGVFTERVRPKIIIAGKLHHVEHCEICKQKNHHTHEHHLYHPQRKHAMKHHSGQKHHSGGVLTRKGKDHNSINANHVSLGRIKIPGVGLKMGKNNIHSVGIKMPHVNL